MHTLLVGRQTVLDKRLALVEEEGEDVHPRTLPPHTVLTQSESAALS